MARGFAVAALCAVSALVLAECRDSSLAGEPLPPEGTAVGYLAPPLEGSLATGEPFRLEADEADATVLVFYRGAYCGLCRERLGTLQANRAAFDAVDARVVAVTLDPTAEVRRVREELALDFPVVSADSAVFARWEVLDAGGTPLPAELVLDERGVIRFRHVGRNAADRVGDVALLAVIEAMGMGEREDVR